MTFDEWEKENWMYIDVKENARVIWDAAQSVEREACAKECERIGESYMPKHLIMRMGADDCAASIRKRPNDVV